ncbi:GNAT family N-acetyltransferase [Pseudodesulfovibrio indicus]|uniref:Acetyltransferase (GNAT) family protein n=1 Tax=Pseudodesulfovibrio indicus TaxID=1716143 RepID=A0A126QT17_9BACT|nr:GNAT family N-acetyltransferase [Pseudodesulfovibrio indicus]AMK12948.1 GCN5 family acetyltransferase [Pseudodesulfovibrio indicus]TDT91824.1 acetyltransferase (GNAT) family protein [Pseudodesulfovibrio indicus]
MSDNISISFERDGVDWTRAAEIFEKAPLGTREPDTLRRTFENSDLNCFAWDGDALVGIARALSDGLVQSVIYDLCMLPEYQGKGLGTRMMQGMMERLNTANVVLWAVPGKEGFYARFGFRPMLTAMALVEDPARTASQGYIRL